MPTFDLTTPDGQKFSVEAANAEAATKALQYIVNPPPPGVMIHEPNRSYITGAPDAPSVDTRGMAPGVGLGAAAGEKPGLPSREEAAAALAARRDRISPEARQLAPYIQGGTFGYGDEFASAAAGALSKLRGGEFTPTYNLAQEAQRQDLAQVRQEYPIGSLAAQMAGGAATVPATLALGLGARAANAATPLLGRILSGAGLGAGLGAVTGFGEGSGLEDRLAKTIPGGLTGLAIGGAIPAAAAGVRWGVNAGLDRSSIGRNLRAMGVDRPAGDAVIRSLEADDAFGPAGRQSILAAGPQGMLADAGAASQGLLDVTIQKGGGGSRMARQAIDERGAAARTTLVDALDAALGQPQGIQTSIQGINKAGQPVRHTAYETAYNTPIDYSRPEANRLLGLLQRLRGEGGEVDPAIAEANKLMRLEGEPLSRQVRATIDAQGNVVFDRLPDVRQIDYITRGLRRVAEDSEKKGVMGGPSDTSRVYGKLVGEIRSTTKGLVPEYGDALNAAADDIGRIRALKLGNDILSPTMTRDEVSLALQEHSSSAAEMSLVRAGVRQHIDDQMAKVGRIATDPNVDARQAAAALKDLSSDAANAKLNMILDPLQRADLTNRIDQASRAIQLRANMTTNSKTFGRTVQNEANQQMLEPGPLGAAARGKPVNALQRVVQGLTGRTPAFDLDRSDVMNRQIAELLTVARGPAAQQQLDTLRQAYTVGPQNAARAERAGGDVGLGAGVPGYQLLRGLLGY